MTRRVIVALCIMLSAIVMSPISPATAQSSPSPEVSSPQYRYSHATTIQVVHRASSVRRFKVATAIAQLNIGEATMFTEWNQHTDAAHALASVATNPAYRTQVGALINMIHALAPPPPRVVSHTPTSTPVVVSAIVSTQCGGSLPSCSIMQRESHGDTRIWNGGCYAPIGWTGSRSPCGGSTASGKWQIVRGTWNGFDGYLNAADAPEAVQDAKARILWAGGAGCGHWSC